MTYVRLKEQSALETSETLEHDINKSSHMGWIRYSLFASEYHTWPSAARNQTWHFDTTLGPRQPQYSARPISRSHFSPNNSRKTTTAKYGCLSWDQNLAEFCIGSVYCVQYRAILHRDLSRVYSIVMLAWIHSHRYGSKQGISNGMMERLKRLFTHNNDFSPVNSPYMDKDHTGCYVRGRQQPLCWYFFRQQFSQCQDRDDRSRDN